MEVYKDQVLMDSSTYIINSDNNTITLGISKHQESKIHWYNRYDLMEAFLAGQEVGLKSTEEENDTEFDKWFTKADEL